MWTRTVLRAEMKRTWITLWRYPLETLSRVVTMGIFVVVAWVGLRAAFFAKQGPLGASAALLWPLVLTGFGVPAGYIEEDIKLGTVEQLYLSAPSMLGLLHVRYAVAFLETLLTVAPLWVLAGFYMGWATVGRWLAVQVVPLGISLYGLGLVLGGLALRARRLGELLNALYFVLFALAVVSWPQKGIWPWVGHFFPMVGVSATPTWPAGWWLRYLAALLYLLAGMWAFRRMEATAKRRGLIGRY